MVPTPFLLKWSRANWNTGINSITIKGFDSEFVYRLDQLVVN